MIPWWWAVVALFLGEVIAVWVISLCSDNDKSGKHRYFK